MKEILERIEKQINILQEKYKDDFFEKYAQDLEKGLYVIHPDYGIILKEDLDEDELAELEGK